MSVSMPEHKRQKIQAAEEGGRDTAFSTVAGFFPLLLRPRPAREACTAPQVSFWDAISGRVAAGPADIKLSPEEAFVCGGQHTGERTPLRHWRGAGLPRIPSWCCRSFTTPPSSASSFSTSRGCMRR